MAFQMDVSDSYLWLVEVPVINEKGARTKMGFKAEFRRMPQSEIDRIAEQIGESEVTDQDLVNDVMVGWSGVKQGKDEVEFTAINLLAICEITPTRSCILEAWLDSLTEGKRKN